MVTTEKATAAAKPRHSGIFFYPASVPSLLMSSPNMFLRSMYSRTRGMSACVVAAVAAAVAARRARVVIGSCGKSVAAAVADRRSVRVNCLIHVVSILIRRI